MNCQQFKKFLAENPEARRPHFVRRPHWTRRNFFQILGAGVAGSYLTREARADTCSSQNVTPQNTARNVIFILMAGAPSHVDTFDFKMTNGVTPSAANPATINGILWPTGILPNLGNMLGDIAIVRSAQAHALVHSLGQTWVQIGRNPAAALGDIAPNIGSIVALEKAAFRKPSDVLPTFLALNSDAAVSSGYLDASYAPFKYNPTAAGLPDTQNAFGQARWQEMFNTLHTEDDVLRINSPLGKPAEDMNGFYESARSLMYNPSVQSVFSYAAADSQRYGNNSFGNACLVAKQALAANQGTRFIEIMLGSWDHHQDIYAANNLPRMAKLLDDGVSALLNDLKSAGLLNETLVVMMGEFGRTIGKLTAQNGRDHHLQQFCVFAGAGVQGGRALGSTDDTGGATKDFAWPEQRDMKPEDIEATIYSAMGINWTNIRYDDPFGRGFEYVPGADQGTYKPIDVLWTAA
jgi:hypothetical protein